MDLHILDIQFVGGDISTGSTDVMKSDDRYNAFNSQLISNCYVMTATVCANMSEVSLLNLHTSANVHFGSGEQFYSMIAGIAAGGNAKKIENCSNSTDKNGGFRELSRKEAIENSYYNIGGVFGGVSCTDSAHVVNYGNIYGAVLVGDGSKNLYARYDYYNRLAGVSLGTLSGTGYILNKGMIFDGPVVQDQNGAPIFDDTGEEGVAPKPRMVPLPEGRVLLGNVTDHLSGTRMWGCTVGSCTKACNRAGIYAVYLIYDGINGVGGSVKESCNLASLYAFSGINQYF